MSFFSRAFIAILGIVFLITTGPRAYETVKGWITGEDWRWWQGDAVTSPERAKELLAKNQREQLISFRNALQNIDQSRYELFAIGVGQVTLPDPETIPDDRVTVTGSREAGKNLTTEVPNELPQVFDKDLESSRTYPIYGQFNNIVLFDKKQDTFTPIFDKRVAISRFQVGWQSSRPILMIFATETDSDGDGSLGRNDLEELYVYAFDDKSLHRVQLEHLHVEAVMDVPKTDYLVVQYRVDRNKNGEIESGYGEKAEEPATLMRIDLKTFEARPFVPGEVAIELQRILDGRAKPAVPPAQ